MDISVSFYSLKKAVFHYSLAFEADLGKARNFFSRVYENGIFLNPMGTKLYLSLAHTDEDIEKMIEISRMVLKKIGL